ncbi:uncharacterized protein C8Q71DRAFT_727693 [Rhodofomes roseus]|uniref:Uncharacterized protein n=1 Tax=Rhodofomes roseus TaxID=34475 RepID=A0ABQ8K0S7_9APHY|nr:uncharacterized protein C8Q71DRAFT_727693 [Rhodofomes roseus]KAH9830200.1 hypothetical protein C8Q71DRAFT_727693 [Rhodofomes roseus]
MAASYRRRPRGSAYTRIVAAAGLQARPFDGRSALDTTRSGAAIVYIFQTQIQYSICAASTSSTHLNVASIPQGTSNLQEDATCTAWAWAAMSGLRIQHAREDLIHTPENAWASIPLAVEVLYVDSAASPRAWTMPAAIGRYGRSFRPTPYHVHIRVHRQAQANVDVAA